MTEPMNPQYVTKTEDPEGEISKEHKEMREVMLMIVKKLLESAAPIWHELIKLEKQYNPRAPIMTSIEGLIDCAQKVEERILADEQIYDRVPCPTCKGQCLLPPDRDSEGNVVKSHKCPHCFAGFVSPEKAKELSDNGNTND